MASAQGGNLDFVGGSRRADGTFRPARRVKPGYTPPDEVDKYKSSGTAHKEWQQSGPKAGFSDAASVKVPLTKNQKKAAARKAKRAQNALLGEAAVSAAPVPAAAEPATSDPTPPAPAPAPAVAVDPAKREKNLRKKLRAIDKLQGSIDSGNVAEDSLDPDQKKKLESRAAIEAELASLSLQ